MIEVCTDEGWSPPVAGIYPFGRPALRRSPRVPWTAHAAAFVLGVHAGALRVRWTRPTGGPIAALAVDDEPEWCPTDPDHTSRIDAWRHTVGWRPEWGTVDFAGHDPARLLRTEVLDPLGLDPRAVYSTDCLPTYLVKSGARQDRAIAQYNAFAVSAGLPRATLHHRPDTRSLVHQALRQEGRELLGQLRDADAPVVITLGKEAADVFAGLAGVDRVPFRLTGDYGTPRQVPLGGRDLCWYPLIHPATRRGAGWRNTHTRWVLEQTVG
ncbi:hypothetical protein [Actinokineospora inagensis]|uniref:hypothetical protein n=1 Tax=Actinokineospora inagensis TaxID=103730 RepID=UPI00042188EE|nr:hypothetical protein [Actinokineospora inagensis]